jgi:cytochrome c oxidase subunit II
VVVGTPFWPSSPAGSEAHRVAGAWWIVFALGVAVAAVVLATVLVAMGRRPRATAGKDAIASTHRRFIIGGGLVFPVVVLTVVAAVTIDSTATLRRPNPNALKVDVTAAQWFWRINYVDSGVVTANELRLPVDRPVAVRVLAQDVIHSFWVPQLAGKLDAIPGQTSTLTFTPQSVGTFRGECAEFCGLQHANMNFVVDVLSQADFDAWITQHQQPPPPPTDPLAAAGRTAFTQLPCAGCHTIRGLTDGTIGPDLTDVGGRSALGSGIIANTPDNLAAWINDAPAFKPGTKMPRIDLTPDQINSVVAYLRSLR